MRALPTLVRSRKEQRKRRARTGMILFAGGGKVGVSDRGSGSGRQVGCGN